MSYEVTATKYRPQTFDDLIGQDFAAATLKNSILNNRISHAYLLSGPRGVGKTSTARIIAKALNCTNGPTDKPCNVCENCTTITKGINTNVIEIDGASNTSINDIRVIQEEILYPPVNLNYKVYIIDEVHMLSKSAFNALLKTIEEPPEHVIFIFATTEVNKVLATIRSRCQQFNLRLIPTELIQKSLKNVLSSLNISYEQDALYWIANEGKGSMRDSYTLLDQVIAFSGENITLEKIKNKLGLINEEHLLKIIFGIGENNREEIFSIYYQLLENGILPEQFIIELIKYFRILFLLKNNISNNKLLVLSNKSYLSENLLDTFSSSDIENILEVLFTTYEKVRYSIDINTEVELCLIKLIQYRDFIRPKQIIQNLVSIKESLTKNATTTFVEKKNDFSESIDFQKKESNVKKKEIKLSSKTFSGDILKSLKSLVSPINFQLINALNNVSVVEEKDGTINLYFSQQIYADIAINNHNLLESKIKTVINESYSLKIIYKQSLKSKDIESISEINKSKIIEIFDGIELI